MYHVWNGRGRSHPLFCMHTFMYAFTTCMWLVQAARKIKALLELR